MDKPLKVLHLFDLYLPQTMNWAYQMLRHTPGVEQWIAAPWFVKNAYFDPQFRFLVRGVQRMPGLLPPDESWAPWFSTNLIRLEKHWPSYKPWLFRQLEKHPPDLIHAHFAPVACHYLDMAKTLGIPMVVSFYGYDFLRVPQEKPAYRQLYRQLFEQASGITTTGPYTPMLLEAQGCAKEKITILPLGISPQQYPKQSKEKTPESLRLLQIATITAKKGHLDTLRALQLALVDCPNIHLTIAGEPQDKELLKDIDKFIKVNQLESHVSCLGTQQHDAIPQFLAQYDVFIHPSCSTEKGDSEGAPVVILEAQAMGLPVIATTHADIPAEVLHGVTGLLSPERSPDDLAQSIARFYFMENVEYQLFSCAARAHVAQYFDVNKSGIILQSIYRNSHRTFRK